MNFRQRWQRRRDSAVYRLARHFFSGFFDLGFLSEDGKEGFERMIIGICAVFVSFGLLLTRIFMGHYRGLMDLPLASRVSALMADDAFIMAIPMWIVAFVTALESHALFPDETDFRVLMALPVTQRLIFGSKLLALGVFAGLFIVSAHVALTPLLVLSSMGRWVETPFAWRAAAFVFSSLCGSIFATVAIVAVNGLLVMLLPRGRLLGASAAMRSGILCALVLVLPFLGRLPAQGRFYAAGAARGYFTPPAWFAAIERVLTGDTRPYFLVLAAIGLLAILVAGAVAVGAYVVLYRHFDRVLLRPVDGAGGAQVELAAGSWQLRMRDTPARSAYRAIRRFTGLTLGRSVLHQGVVVCVSAAGIGFVLNTLIAADLSGWMRDGGRVLWVLVSAVTWAPFALMYAMAIAVRAALVLPVEPRANWVFRMTEDDAVRADQLQAAMNTVVTIGIVAPLAAMFPLQWLVLGPRGAFVGAAVGGIWGLLFAEVVMRKWARIPFTCSYIPGKRFIPQSILIVFVTFILFTGFGGVFTRAANEGLTFAFVINALVFGIVLLLRRARLAAWKSTPLAFEDEMPQTLYVLPDLRMR